MWDSRISEALPRVRDRIRAARERAGRTGDVRLIAVTKGHPASAAAAAARAGLTDLGENRVQELETKVAEVGRDAADWHLIGHLQRNKARSALALFDWIHSLDSHRLARTLSKEAGKADRTVKALLQVNVSGEETKGGFEEAEASDALGRIAELGGVQVHGLMTMAPWTDDETVLRRTFSAAARLLERCAAEHPDALHGRELSMGMSNDFEIAVEEGATMVRLGTVLFGEREP